MTMSFQCRLTSEAQTRNSSSRDACQWHQLERVKRTLLLPPVPLACPVIPTVLINGVDKTEFVKSSNDTLIKMKGKAKKYGLVTGANTIQIKTSTGIFSNTFTVTR